MATWNRAFWKATAERVIGTFVASLIAVLSVETAENVANTDWVNAGWLIGVTTMITFLKCLLANVTPGATPGPSFTKAEQLKGDVQ